jgi:hypothetical protein
MSLVRKHPLWWAASTFAFVSFPQWVQSIWGLWSADPLAPLIIAKLNAMDIPTFSAYWITLPVGLVMFFLIWRETRKQAAATQIQAQADLEKQRRLLHKQELKEAEINLANERVESTQRFQQDLRTRADQNRLQLTGKGATPTEEPPT